MQNRIWIVTLLTIFVLFLGNKSAFAVETPNFPSCSNPQGTVQSPTSEGAHGIVGDTSEHDGSDTVYKIENNYIQCFCQANEEGIQTNWWKNPSLTSEQLQVLKNEGWINIPNGGLWGLDEVPFMTLNSNFNCQPSGGIGGGGGQGGPGTGVSDNLGCSTHDCSNQGGVLGTGIGGGEVLGLAATGGNYLPFILAAIGFISLVSGIVLSRKTSVK